MLYRKLGKTGYEISQLGFGAMRLPMTGEGKDAVVDLEKAVPMIHRAFEAGVNYIDTAVMYCNDDSQKAVGEALVGWRDKVVLSTKNHYFGDDEKEWWKNLENSLEYLRTDSIDIYNMHGVNWKQYTEHIEPRVLKWMSKAKDQGMIKHICCSFHDNNEALEKIVETGFPSVITLQYNLLDRQLEPGIKKAHDAGIGVVVMGPVGGGRLAEDSPELRKMIPGIERVPELAMRFVLANPNVSLALSGMSTLEQVEDNIRICSDPSPLSDEEHRLIGEHLQRLKKMAELYCTGCRYCLPCPQNVAIPEIFGCYNMGRVYGLWNHARNDYKNLDVVPWYKDKKPASECVDCGKCEDKCPQNIPIRKQLKEAHEALHRG